MITVIDGKAYSDEQVFSAIQKHLEVGNLPGDKMHVFRTCRKWHEKEKGVPYHWKQIGRDYEAYVASGELPQCTWDYYAAVVEPALRAKAEKETIPS